MSRGTPLKKKPIVVAVSGGFDPVHVGHVELFKRARKLGDKLVVILNNDHWLEKKKQCVFMPQGERKKIIESLRYVDKVVVTRHEPNPADISVCRELRKIKPDIFANGGDRFSDNIPEVGVCRLLGCKMVFGVGRKIQSSSWLLGNYVKSSATANNSTDGKPRTV